MNAENFAEVLKNTSQLYQISYQELKSLVLQYPYCRNLHYLLLKKSHINQRADFERTLEKTATYSIDRRYLYLEMRVLQPQEEALSDSFELGEDYLELRDLNSLQEDREPIPLHLLREEENTSATTPTSNGQSTNSDDVISPDFSDMDAFEADTTEELPIPPLDLSEPLEETEVSRDSLKDHPEASHHVEDELLLDYGSGLEAVDLLYQYFEDNQPHPTASFTSVSSLAESLSAMLNAVEQCYPPATDTIPTPAATPARPQPKPKSSFKSWVKQFQPAHVQPHIDELMENVEPKKHKFKNKSRIVSFAEQSLREHEEVVSETLAELLVQQERYGKAIQMYRRLSLIFPEKSAYFAQIIEELQKQQ